MTSDEREQMWQQHITALQASGLSGMAYCRQHALTYSQFNYWRKKLAGADTVANDPAPSGFTRVAPISEVEGPSGLTVSLPGGVSITGLQADNIELLGAVLRHL